MCAFIEGHQFILILRQPVCIFPEIDRPRFHPHRCQPGPCYFIQIPASAQQVLHRQPFSVFPRPGIPQLGTWGATCHMPALNSTPGTVWYSRSGPWVLGHRLNWRPVAAFWWRCVEPYQLYPPALLRLSVPSQRLTNNYNYQFFNLFFVML